MKIRLEKIAGDEHREDYIRCGFWAVGFAFAPMIGNQLILTEVSQTSDNEWNEDVYLGTIQKVTKTGWGWIVKCDDMIWTLKQMTYALRHTPSEDY